MTKSRMHAGNSRGSELTTSPARHTFRQSGMRLTSAPTGWLISPRSPTDRDELTILDVRQTDEFDESHITGAVNIPLHELVEGIDELPVGEVWVHCASGYRASIAASILDRHERDVVLIDDEFDKAEELNLTRDSVD